MSFAFSSSNPSPSPFPKSRKSSSELNNAHLKRSTSLNFRSFTPQFVRRVPSSASSNITIQKRNTNSIRRIKTNLLRSFSSNSNSPLGQTTTMDDCFKLDNSIPTGLVDDSSSSDDSFNSNEDLDYEQLDYDTSYSSNNTSPESNRIQKFDNYQFNPRLDLLQDLNYIYSTPPKKECHQIFKIPEIVDIIIRYVNEDVTIPQEPVMIKRSPSSLNHAVIQYGENLGPKIWNQNGNDNKLNYKRTINKNMFNCLLVSKLWNFVTIQILNEYIYITNSTQLENLTSTLLTKSTTKSIGNFEKVLPRSIILHKVKTYQSVVDLFLNNVNGLNLNWIEFYICPNILPHFSIVTKSLKKLVLPGCSMLNDDDLKSILIRAPNLNHLDIRACNLVTDASIYFIGEYCKDLELLNCGRHTNGELITDASIGNVIKNCKLKTIGLAGCGISDWSIWELAIKNGKNLQRLSINYCWKLTDLGICKTLKARLFENLSVLEIKDLNIANPKEICLWKKYVESNGQKIILEACEALDEKMNLINNSI